MIDVETIFAQQLELAKEDVEADLNESQHYEHRLCVDVVLDNYDNIVWNRATEWTLEEITNQAHQIIGQKWAAKQDAVNKAHFDGND